MIFFRNIATVHGWVMVTASSCGQFDTRLELPHAHECCPDVADYLEANLLPGVGNLIKTESEKRDDLKRQATVYSPKIG